MNNFRNILIALFFIGSCKNDVGLGRQYQKVLLAQKNNETIYCYNLMWAFDSEAFFISSNKDICIGFDSTKDYCYGKGNQVIYYKFENDTLRVYSYGSKPTVPKASSINIALVNLKHSDLDEYENKFKEKKLEKVTFDSLYDLPCEIVGTPINLLNVKFKDSVSK